LEENRDGACLDQNTVEEMAKTFKTIETLYDFPQDIEWTITNDTVHILQARPVTTITKSQYIEETSVETIWDNSNIVESYSGVTSPLTFSFIRHAYYMVYLQFCQVLRVPEKVINHEDNNLRNMLGSLNGQVYYNLKNWYRLVSHLPGYNYNKAFMEQMMGVAEEAKFDASSEKQISVIKKYLVELPQLVMAGCSLFFQFLTMAPRVTVFMKRVAKYYEKYRRSDFDAVSAHRLHEIYQELEKEVLMHWKAPIVNDFLIMICYGILKNLTAVWGLDEKGTLANDLLCGQGDVESTLPMKMLLSISEDIKADKELTRQFSSLSQTELKERYIDADEKSLSLGEKMIRKRLLEYLDEYGFRCMNELKLEEPSLSEKPDFIFMMLKNYLNA
jgi:pyruvate,water dikinase